MSRRVRKNREPKTSGIEFLQHSLGSFNGSGYADMRSATTFLDSYIAYKRWDGRNDIADLAAANREKLEPFIAGVIERTHGAGRRPSQKALSRFSEFYAPAGIPGYCLGKLA
jgi:hypothetical protein